MNEITVLILERYPLGGGAAGVLKDRRGLRVVAVPTLDEAVRNGELPKPDIVLFDLATSQNQAGARALSEVEGNRLPTSHGPVAGTLRNVCCTMADAKVIVVYDDVERSDLLDCLLAGAKGCIHRDRLPTDLEKAVRVVHQGEAWVSRRMVAEMIDRFCQAASGESESRAALPHERKPAASLPKILC